MYQLLQQLLDFKRNKAISDTTDAIREKFAAPGSYPHMIMTLLVRQEKARSKKQIELAKKEVLLSYLYEVEIRHAKLKIIAEIACRLSRNEYEACEIFDSLQLEIDYDEMSVEGVILLKQMTANKITDENYTQEQAYAYCVSIAESQANRQYNLSSFSFS